MKYNVGDKFKCIKDFHMADGELAFKKGKVYINKIHSNDKCSFLSKNWEGIHYMNFRLVNEFFIKIKNKSKLPGWF